MHTDFSIVFADHEHSFPFIDYSQNVADMHGGFRLDELGSDIPGVPVEHKAISDEDSQSKCTTFDCQNIRHFSYL